MSAAWKFFTTQKQWRLYLQDLVKTNDTALLRAIVLIYNNQTYEEKQSHEAKDENNIGFTKHDAKEMSEIAEKIIKGEQLTAGELAKSRNKMTKYWHQLMDISLRQQKEQESASKQPEPKKVEEPEQVAPEPDRDKVEQFKSFTEAMRKCSEDGIACEYGICDECPVVTGLQMRINVGGL